MEERLTERLRQLSNEEREFAQAQKDRERWMKQRSPLVERAQLIEAEFGRQNKALLRDRENDLPKYLENAVGRGP